VGTKSAHLRIFLFVGIYPFSRSAEAAFAAQRRDKAAKEVAENFCDTVKGERLCGTGYGLAYTESLIATTKERAIELSKRYEKLK